MKKCPFCAEKIQDAAIKCKYCQSSLPANSVGIAPNRSDSYNKKVPFPISRKQVLIGIGCFFLFVWFISAISSSLDKKTNSDISVSNSVVTKSDASIDNPEFYEAKMLSPNRLYPTAEDCSNKFLTSDLDTTHANNMPMLQDGEKVIASADKSTGYCSVMTADGKRGFVPAIMLSDSPQEKKVKRDNNPAVVEARDFLSNHPLPPIIPFKKPTVIENIEYKVYRTERLKNIGDGESRAKSGDGYSFLVVYYTAKNVGKMGDGLANSLVVLDTNNNLYPWEINASAALWEKIPDPVEIQPGKQTKCAIAFAVPDSVSNDQLKLLIPGMSDYPAQLALK